MSSGEVRKLSRQDLQLVQNLIERCLQLYMSQKEAISTLLHRAKIEPDFTELVWQKLEEQNQDFFKAYHLRLIVKDQIVRFNELLQRQVELMQQICPTGISSIPMSDESQIPSRQHNLVGHAAEHNVAALKSETMQLDVSNNFPRYNNGRPSLQPCMQNTMDLSAQVRRIDASQNMLITQSSNGQVMQGMNVGLIKSEAVCPINTPFMYGGGGTVTDARSSVGDATVSSFSIMASNSLPSYDAILDADTSSFGFLGQIPRNFSLSDLAADFSNSSDILESYPRSPFIAADPNAFLDPQGRAEHHGVKRLVTITEGLSFEGFGSD